MAKDKIIVEYEADVAKITKQLTDLEKKYGAVQDKSNEAGASATNAFANAEKGSSKLQTSLGALSTKVNTAFNSEKVTKMGDALQSLPGPIGNATSAVDTLGKSFAKLLLNPVVATIALITGALVALGKSFLSTDEGANKFDAVLGRINATIDVLKQRLAVVAEGVMSLFSGEWKLAAEQFSSAFKGIGEQIDKAAKAANDYVFALDELNDAETAYISKRAENANKIAKLEFLASDRTKTIGARKAALEEAIKISEEQSKRDVKAAEDRLALEIKTKADLIGVRESTLREAVKIDQKSLEARAKNDEDYRKVLNHNQGKTIEDLENFYAEAINKDTEYYETQKGNIRKLSAFQLEIDEQLAKERAKNLKNTVKFQAEFTAGIETDAEKASLAEKEDLRSEFDTEDAKRTSKHLDWQVNEARKTEKEKTQIANEEAKKREEFQRNSLNAIATISITILDEINKRQQENAQVELQRTNDIYDTQLANLEKRFQLEEDGVDARTARERAYDKERKRIEEEREVAIKKQKHDEFERNRIAEIAKANIAGAVSAVEALPNYILSAAIGVTTAVETAFIATQRNPYFKGTPFVQRGNNPIGIDTVPALLTEGERVITVDENRKNWDLYESARKGKLQQHIEFKYVMPALKSYKKKSDEALASVMANNISHSLFNDANLVKELRNVNKTSMRNTYELGKIIKSSIKKPYEI